MAEPTCATEGLAFFTVLAGEHDVMMKVAPACDENRGHWYCVTHDEHFRHQLEKDIHIGATYSACTLAWWCHQHGPEVP